MTIKHPEITVQLTGEDGNAFLVVGKVMKALRRANVPELERKQFQDEATSGNYDNVLQTCMRWVNVE
jgi:hypothetical protein